jgi:pilus assembly protein CpaB
MRIRGFVLTLALLLALGATGAVFLYVQGVRQEAEKSPSGDLVAVIVAKEDIPGGTVLDPLIERGTFDSVRVPKDALVQGVVTDLSQLKRRTTSATILQGEQITAARLQGSASQISPVGLRPGYQAVSISLEMPQGGGGFVQPGDHVTVLTTLKADKKQGGDVTVTTVPDVRVLKVSAPAEGAQSRSRTEDVQFLLELKPLDAQRVIFSKEKGSVWLALLYPGEKSPSLAPIIADDLLTPGAGPA